MFTPLTGSTVLVTGASRGIGKGIATVFAQAGAQVMLSARDETALAAAAGGLPGEVGWVAGDVSTLDGCERIAAATVERFGGIDVVCANAGIFPEDRIGTLTEESVERVFAVNVKGTMFITQACRPALAAGGHGRVVVVSSITGPITGFPGWSHYGASKAAQLGFVRTAAIELAREQITVNAVLPGNIVTEGLTGIGDEYSATMAASIPLGHLGRVEDIGHACLFLASREAGYITGQTLVVDGGQVLPESLEALR